MTDYKKLTKNVEQLKERDTGLCEDFIGLRNLLNTLTTEIKELAEKEAPNTIRELTCQEESLIINIMDPWKQKIDTYDEKIKNIIC